MSDIKCEHEEALCTGIEYVFGDIRDMSLVDLVHHQLKLESLIDLVEYALDQCKIEINARLD